MVFQNVVIDRQYFKKHSMVLASPCCIQLVYSSINRFNEINSHSIGYRVRFLSTNTPFNGGGWGPIRATMGEYFIISSSVITELEDV